MLIIVKTFIFRLLGIHATINLYSISVTPCGSISYEYNMLVSKQTYITACTQWTLHIFRCNVTQLSMFRNCSDVILRYSATLVYNTDQIRL